MKFWKVFGAKIKQVINEAKNYKHIRDIRKQAATDLTGFIINNKYKQTASMKNFIEYVVDATEEDLLCQKGSREDKQDRESRA